MAKLKFSDVFKDLNIAFGIEEDGDKVKIGSEHAGENEHSTGSNIDMIVEPLLSNEKPDFISYFEFSELLKQEHYCIKIDCSDELEFEDEDKEFDQCKHTNEENGFWGETNDVERRRRN